LNQSLRPHTASTGWCWCAEAIFFVRISHIAAVASGTVRKIKIQQALPEFHVIAVIPDVYQLLLIYTAKTGSN